MVCVFLHAYIQIVYIKYFLLKLVYLFKIFLGKKRRLTIIECGNDMNMMVDIAKIADLVRSDE